MRATVSAAGAVALTLALATQAEASLIQGTVRNKVGSPGQGVSVPVLFWQQGGAWQVTVESGPDGHFQQDCPAGAVYNVACNKPDQTGARADLVFVETDNVCLGNTDIVVNFDLDPYSPPSTAPIGLDARGLARAPIVAECGLEGGTTVTGSPYDNGGGPFVHAWGNGWTQDVRGGSGGTGALMYRDGEATAHWVHASVWSVYLAYGGGQGPLGYPTGDDDGQTQTFENGSLVLTSGRWVPSGMPLPLTNMGLAGNAIIQQGLFDLDVDAIAATGTRVLRVNLLRGPWSGPTDSTLYQGRTWSQMADQVVDSLGARGIAVYALLNDELTSTDHDFLRDLSDPTSSRAWIETFAAACEAVVGHLKDRVRVFEVINEPNDYAGGSNARVSAYWQALILRRVYERVKLGHAGDPTWQVTLVSGPIFTFDGSSGGDYLRSVYDDGKASHGWDDVRALAGSYPLDGVGAHLYLVQDPSNVPGDVAPAFGQEIDQLAAVVAAEDPEASAKNFWISEFGWQSSSAGETHQADMLEAGFADLAADPRVALATFFCEHDFQGSTWGLFDSTHRKEAFTRFQAVVTR